MESNNALLKELAAADREQGRMLEEAQESSLRDNNKKVVDAEDKAIIQLQFFFMRVMLGGDTVGC